MKRGKNMSEISKLNASGYRDMTAYAALNNIEREEMKVKMVANPVKDEIIKINQRIEQIELSKCVPTGYQRVTSDSQVKKIVENFDENKLGVLTVSWRDGKYRLADGLHRSKALKILGYTHAPCVVLTGLTYEQEADFFRRQNENRRGITTFDDFKAGLEAKDAVCLEINEILHENGFQIGRGGFFKIASVNALFTIVKDYGYRTLDDTLFILANTWSTVPEASNYDFLLGTAEFIYRYGAMGFTERLKNKIAVIFYDYAEAMRVVRGAKTLPPRMKFCRILVEHYNKGLHGNSKKRLKLEY